MSLPSIQRVRLLLALHLLQYSTQKEERGGREGRGRLSKPRGGKGSGVGEVAKCWVDSKSEGELVEWRRGRGEWGEGGW